MEIKGIVDLDIIVNESKDNSKIIFILECVLRVFIIFNDLFSIQFDSFFVSVFDFFVVEIVYCCCCVFDVCIFLKF